VHSIIIDPNDSTGCYADQNSQDGVKGFYGTQYARLSRPTSALMNLGPLKPGTVGNICSLDYTQQMGDIARYLKTAKVQLPCRPLDGSLKVTYLDSSAPNQNEFITASNELQFSPPIPAGSRVQLEFSCQ
jgi:hypothetical protein